MNETGRLSWPVDPTAIDLDSHSSDDELLELEPLHRPLEPTVTESASQGTKRKADEPIEYASLAKKLVTEAAYRVASGDGYTNALVSPS